MLLDDYLGVIAIASYLNNERRKVGGWLFGWVAG